MIDGIFPFDNGLGTGYNICISYDDNFRTLTAGLIEINGGQAGPVADLVPMSDSQGLQIRMFEEGPDRDLMFECRSTGIGAPPAGYDVKTHEISGNHAHNFDAKLSMMCPVAPNSNTPETAFIGANDTRAGILKEASCCIATLSAVPGTAWVHLNFDNTAPANPKLSVATLDRRDAVVDQNFKYRDLGVPLWHATMRIQTKY